MSRVRVAGTGGREASKTRKLSVAPRSRALAVGEVRIFLAVLVKLVDIAPAAAGADARPPLGPSAALGPLPPPDLQRAGLGIVPPTAPLHVRLHRRQ